MSEDTTPADIHPCLTYADAPAAIDWLWAVFPPLFDDADGWHVEYGKYHSPLWWRDHFASSGALDVTVAREVTDGDVMWEDEVLYRGDRDGWSPGFLDRSAWLIRHILAGRSAPPSLTHCMVVATKRSGL